MFLINESQQEYKTDITDTEQDGVLLTLSHDSIIELQVGDFAGNYRKNRPLSTQEDTEKSVLEHGFLSAVVVRESNREGVYELIAGYGRWEIAKKHNLMIPALNKGQVSDQDALAMALSENLDRSDLSIADEVEHAKRFLSIFNGDHATAAIKLNKSESVYRELLQIGRCEPELIDALDDPERPVLKGHCVILSQFPKAIQLNILKAIEADPRKYTVSFLKSQAKSFELNLKTAKFDTDKAGCANCPFNSNQQFSAFDLGGEDEHCSNPQCFLEKQKEWLNEVRIPELKVTYGTVLTSEEKNINDCKLVSTDSLGEEQAKSCASCEHCVVIVSIDQERYGSAVPNLCLDTSCYREMQTAHLVAQNPKPETNDVDNSASVDSSASAEGKTTTTSTKPKKNTTKASKLTSAPKAKLSKKLQRTYANMAQEVAASAVSTQPIFMQALLVKSLSQSLRYANQIKQPIEELVKLSAQDLSELLKKLVVAFAKQEIKLDSDARDHTDFVANKVFRKSLEHFMPDTAERELKMIAAWKPSKELFEMLTKQQIAIIANESGFEAEYDKTNGTATFAKLMNGKVDVLIVTMLAFAFDWSDYAPRNYLELTVDYVKPD